MKRYYVFANEISKGGSFSLFNNGCGRSATLLEKYEVSGRFSFWSIGWNDSNEIEKVWIKLVKEVSR